MWIDRSSYAARGKTSFPHWRTYLPVEWVDPVIVRPSWLRYKAEIPIIMTTLCQPLTKSDPLNTDLTGLMLLLVHPVITVRKKYCSPQLRRGRLSAAIEQRRVVMISLCLLHAKTGLCCWTRLVCSNSLLR